MKTIRICIDMTGTEPETRFFLYYPNGDLHRIRKEDMQYILDEGSTEVEVSFGDGWESMQSSKLMNPVTNQMPKE